MTLIYSDTEKRENGRPRLLFIECDTCGERIAPSPAVADWTKYVQQYGNVLEPQTIEKHYCPQHSPFDSRR